MQKNSVASQENIPDPLRHINPLKHCGHPAMVWHPKRKSPNPSKVHQSSKALWSPCEELCERRQARLVSPASRVLCAQKW